MHDTNVALTSGAWRLHAVAVNQYPLASHAWSHCLAAVHHACIRRVIVYDMPYLLQARIPSQWLLYAPCSQSCTAWLEPARIAAKGQRHQESVCLSLEAVVTQTGSRCSSDVQ